MGIVYLIQSQTSGKVYVGQTSMPFVERWRHHGRGASYFHASVRKYGKADFLVYTLEECSTQVELDMAEVRWIALLRSTERTHGYNTAPGGNYSPAKLPDVRAKISKTLTGRKLTQQCRDRMRLAQTGKKHSEESKQKCSLSQIGIKKKKAPRS
jgi:group I intron endonuclease